MTKTYAILEDGLPMNGEFYSEDRLWKVLPYADYDARVVAFDAAELGRDLATSLRDVTEDVTIEWWGNRHGASEAYSWIEAGKSAPGLALKYYSDECASYSNLVEAA